ncbi:unnamed protein product [Brassica oleracea]
MQLLSVCDFKFPVQYYYSIVAKTISSVSDQIFGIIGTP